MARKDMKQGSTTKSGSDSLEVYTGHEDNSSPPPPLLYDLHNHRRQIAIFWTLTVLTSGVIPIVLYFTLKYLTNRSPYLYLGVSLASPGVLSLYTETLRTWRLWKKDSVYRPIGVTSCWAFDMFEWNFILSALIVVALIVAGTSIPSAAISSLPIAALVLSISSQLLLAEFGLMFNIKTPFRISSVAIGQAMRPGVYTVVEDVVGVDGGGGTAFRIRWDARYRASRQLRAHLVTMDLLWGGSGVLVAGAIFGVVFGIDDPDIGYAMGWSLPWVWGGFMTCLTIVLSKRMLRQERQEHERTGNRMVTARPS